jgi:hypothetical protein
MHFEGSRAQRKDRALICEAVQSKSYSSKDCSLLLLLGFRFFSVNCRKKMFLVVNTSILELVTNSN